MQVRQYEPPVDALLADELVEFWQTTFEVSFDEMRAILAGEESAHNHDVFQVARVDGRLAGSCHSTIGRSSHLLGGLGEVAVPPEFRGQGIANSLCAQARDAFQEAGGRALFLGTVNSHAARVYHRLGWRKLEGTNVMVVLSDSQSPADFLADYFHDPAAVSVFPGTAADRLAIIPLIMTPHDEFVLDANLDLFSSRYTVQNSCMGLYSKYDSLGDDGRGAWFVARSERGRVVGLSSVNMDDSHRAQIDGFVHQDFLGSWSDLIVAPIEWAAKHHASLLTVKLCDQDKDKLRRFPSLGFKRRHASEGFLLDQQQFGTTWLERAI